MFYEAGVILFTYRVRSTSYLAGLEEKLSNCLFSFILTDRKAPVFVSVCMAIISIGISDSFSEVIGD